MLYVAVTSLLTLRLAAEIGYPEDDVPYNSGTIRFSIYSSILHSYHVDRVDLDINVVKFTYVAFT